VTRAAALAAAVVLPLAVAAAEGTADLLKLRVRHGVEPAVTLGQRVGDARALIAFSATYCPPCRLEVPVLRRAAHRWRPEGLRVITIMVDADDAAEAAAVAREWGIDYELYWLAAGDRKDASRLAAGGLPVTFFVGHGEVSRLDRFLTDEDVDRLVPVRLDLHGDPQ